METMFSDFLHVCDGLNVAYTVKKLICLYIKPLAQIFFP